MKSSNLCQPLFSVVVNNYNYSAFLPACLDSVLAQTCKGFELIVVDDGSTDLSREVIDGYRRRDGRIVPVYKENGGQASALNAGFALARGKYIAFLDSDDLFAPDKLELIAGVYDKHDYAVVQHQLRLIDAQGRESGELHPVLRAGELDVLPLYFRYRHTSYFSATSGIAARRRILQRIFPLPEADWKICADVPLTRPLPVFGKVYTMPKPVGWYRIHDNNNWMHTEEQRRTSFNINGKINRYTNAFLRRWGISEQIGISLPTEWMAKRKIHSIALYGAGKHTRYLLECQELPPDIMVKAIVDDKPTSDMIAGLPVSLSTTFDARSCDAVLVSSDTFEAEMTRKAFNMGWSNVAPIYSVNKYRRTCNAHIRELTGILRRHGKKRIALYGAGVHSINLILSELLPPDIEVTCMLDERIGATMVWDIPVLHPAKADRSIFDAVVLSSDVYEHKMFYQARDYGFDSIYLIYGAKNALKQNRADFEDIRKGTSAGTVRRIALFDVCWFNQTLLQSGYLNGTAVACVLSHGEPPVKSLCDVFVMVWDDPTLPDFDLLVVPPRVPKEMILKLRGRFGNKILALTENPDEISLVHAVLRGKIEDPVMLDVGANIGHSLAPFAKDGWQIHAFEPDSIHRKTLVKSCAGYPRVTIYSVALSNQVAEKIPLYRGKVSGGISGLSVFHQSHYLAEYIRTTTLAWFVKEHGLTSAEFLKIDTEGYDLFVLQGNDWGVFRPRMIMCEFENHKTLPLGYDFDGIAGYLHHLGYHLIISEWNPVIEYGNQPRWRRFVNYPCALLDPDGFGNILAFRGKADYELFKASIGL